MEAKYLQIANIDDTPVDAETEEPISSNWAYDHDADVSAHHVKYTDAEAVDAVEAVSLLELIGDLTVGGNDILNNGTTFKIKTGSGGNSNSQLLLDFPDISTAYGRVRLFRSTNTSGTCALQICDASGADVTAHNFDTNGDAIHSGDLTVLGNDIKSSTGATAITLNGEDVIIGGDITVGSPSTTWESFHAIGSANAQYIPCCFMGGEDGEQDAGQYGIIRNLTGNNPYWAWVVPLPTSKGGLFLYVDDVVIGIEAADGNNYITGCQVRGMTGELQTVINESTTNKSTAGDATYSFTGKDASGYDVVKVILNTVTTDAEGLKLNYVKLRYWYA